MIEGGGLGAYAPSEVGPVSIQEPNGVIDILMADEAAATVAAKHYLSFFQGRISSWTEHDQRILRHIVPENRRAVYDIRKVIETLADVGSVLELRPKFGVSMVTAFDTIDSRSRCFGRRSAARATLSRACRLVAAVMSTSSTIANTAEDRAANGLFR